MQTSESNYSDSELVARLLEKDREAFQQVVGRYQPSMRALAARFVGDARADEVVQESWMAIMHGLSTFEGRSSLRTWILSIVSNEARMCLRKEKPSLSLEELGGQDVPSRFDEQGRWLSPPDRWELNSPDAILTATELRDCIKVTVASLPAMQASTLQLREIDSLDFTDICNILQISESNARVLLHRARRNLYQVIEHFQSTGDCKPCASQ